MRLINLVGSGWLHALSMQFLFAAVSWEVEVTIYLDVAFGFIRKFDKDLSNTLTLTLSFLFLGGSM